MDDSVLQKLAISGPTLASMIQRLSSSPSDVDGLLFGHVTHISPSTLSDDSAQSSTDSQLLATISAFLCFPSLLSFYDSLGRVDSSRLSHLNHKPIIGWFSSRRKTPLHPSMREVSVTRSLSSTPNLSFPIQNADSNNTLFAPSIFLLFTTPVQDQFIHTNQYRAFQFQSSKPGFNPLSIDVVNIGPAFRGHYGSFSPNSALPFLNCELRSLTAMNEDNRNLENLIGTKRTENAQTLLDTCAEGMQVGSLSRLIGPAAINYTAGLEDLYGKMLSKIESLARLVETSSAKVLEQENQNRKLRYKVARSAGIE